MIQRSAIVAHQTAILRAYSNQPDNQNGHTQTLTISFILSNHTTIYYYSPKYSSCQMSIFFVFTKIFPGTYLKDSGNTGLLLASDMKLPCFKHLVLKTSSR
ncbi:unnamed protein product [Owenia fusiformis]|uniref:Uncharacterized protein n=1 Tax=Owenia fusiformis TaxID=6347 RepID=A0A8J1UQC1_OWEFU|nr:unnamed protein product [Owenia fusiformis]